MRNGLTTHFKPQYRPLVINMILFSFPTSTELHDNTIICPHETLFDKVEDNISNLPSSLALHKSLITIYYLFSLSTSLKILPNLVGSLSKWTILKELP